jgi:hypothetical protein
MPLLQEDQVRAIIHFTLTSSHCRQIVTLEVYWDASIPAAANGIPEALHEQLLYVLRYRAQNQK